MNDEQKAKMKEGREKAKLEKENKFVSSEVFNEFKTSLEGKLGSIVDVLSTLANKTEEKERKVMMATNEVKVDQGSISNSPSSVPVVHNLQNVDVKYQSIFEKYLDPEDGFKAMVKGVDFLIEVPLNLSNAIEAHKSFYKKDIRHKVLDPHDLEGSMERYCKMVAQNLNYKRNIKLKI